MHFGTLFHLLPNILAELNCFGDREFCLVSSERHQADKLAWRKAPGQMRSALLASGGTHGLQSKSAQQQCSAKGGTGQLTWSSPYFTFLLNIAAELTHFADCEFYLVSLSVFPPA